MQAPTRVTPESKVIFYCKLFSLETNETIVDERTAPVELDLKNADIIVGLYVALLGMVPKEKKIITFSPMEAYGKYEKKLSHTVNIKELPEDFEPKIGNIVLLKHSSDTLPSFVTGIDGDMVTIDTNHPLAGHRLQAEIEIVEIL